MQLDYEQIPWHEIIQEILDKYLALMSGKVIRQPAREYPKYFQVDYYCLAGEELPAQDRWPGILLPFDHLKQYNIIEYKSIHQVLNEGMFRQYVARALFLENPEQNISYRGQTTLTILTTRKPETIIANPRYAMSEIFPWKYRSDWVPDLDIYILVQKEMRGIKAGEALALLQVLEGEKDKQIKCWQEILSQELSNTLVLQEVIQKLGKERFMNFVQELTERGKKIGKELGLQEGKELGLQEGKELGLQEGLQQDILDVLEMRFERVPPEIAVQIQEIHDLKRLRTLLKKAVVIADCTAFAKVIDEK